MKASQNSFAISYAKCREILEIDILEDSVSFHEHRESLLTLRNKISPLYNLANNFKTRPKFL